MEESNSNAKVFIGNLPFGTTQETLKGAFGEFGEITDCYVPMDRESGRPKPFGFVTFKDAAAAQAAITKMSGQPLPGDEGQRPLTVNLARPKEERPAHGGGNWNNNRGGNRTGGFQPRSNNGGSWNRDRGNSYGSNDSSDQDLAA